MQIYGHLCHPYAIPCIMYRVPIPMPQIPKRHSNAFKIVISSMTLPKESKV